MAYNKVIYKGDVLMDITDSTVTAETLGKDVVAYAANGERIVGTGAGGSGAKLGELTITKNGEYEASVNGILETDAKIYDSTVPHSIEFEIDSVSGGFWKVSEVPNNFEAFKERTSIKIVSLDGEIVEEVFFKDAEWDGAEGIAFVSPPLYIVYDPVMFEQMMGVQLGFEKGVYMLDPGANAQGMKYVLTSFSTVPVDGYSKVSVNVPGGNLDWILTDNGLEYTLLNGDLVVRGESSIADELFEYNSDIKRVFIMEGVTSIGSNAFSGCTGLTSITIPDSVTTIGNRAFYNCTGLTSIVIPDSITTIDEGTFNGCASLTSITIPDSVTTIGNRAFYNCTGLISITIPDSVTTIGDYAFFGCTSLTSITIPDSVTSIGREAFYNCTGLTSITIPDSVTSIGMGAFGGTPWLAAKRQENPLIIVNNIVYDGRTCSGKVVIPDGVTTINVYAFRNCTGLTSITIPDSVTTIGDYAFYYCDALSSITYTGTIAQWNAISLGLTWDSVSGIDNIYCTDGYIAN